MARAMNIIEKIIAHHAIGLSSPYVKPGEAVCVRVDWTMANELTLVGINDMYTKIGRPGVANKERVVRFSFSILLLCSSCLHPLSPARLSATLLLYQLPPYLPPPIPVARRGPHRGPPQLPRAQTRRADQTGG